MNNLFLLLILTVLAIGSLGDNDESVLTTNKIHRQTKQARYSKQSQSRKLEDAPGTIVDVAVGAGTFNTLVAAVTAANLVDALSGDGPFTVFAPTDDAFDALPDGTLDALLTDPSGDLLNILLYHVVDGTVMSTDLMTGAVPTVGGASIMVDVGSDGSITLNDSIMVTVADIPASNGVIHAINAVLIPPSEVVSILPPSHLETVVDTIVGLGGLDTLVAAVSEAGLVHALSGDGPFTVFAPTDDAFDALPDGTLDALLTDPSGDLTDILLYHLVVGKVMSTDLATGLLTTVEGSDIAVDVSNDGVTLNDSIMVTVADIPASNGVIHVINAVLLPPTPDSVTGDDPPITGTIVDVVIESGGFETLVTAVSAADLVGTLSGEGPFTLFAPTDAFFLALPEGALDSLLADPFGALTDVLLYHVIGGKVMSTDLVNGPLTTVGGSDITVNVTDGVTLNGNIDVLVTDIPASNGVIHVIGGVLFPSR